MKRIHLILALVSFIACTNQLFGQGENAVGQRTFSFEDKSRSRKLITEVWYPSPEKPSAKEPSPFIRIPTARNATISKGTFPVILFSHGTGGGRLTVEWFCAGLASHGFIVIAVDHFGNTFDNAIPVEFVKFWERPQDIRFVLDELLVTSDISSSMDVKRIGAAGFSLGGFTAIALAGAKMDYTALENYFKTESGKKEAEIPEMPGLVSFLEKSELHESFEKAPPLNDKRIKSVFVMSPAIGQTFPAKENFKNVSVPVYIVAAGSDQIAPLKTNASHYAAMIVTSQYKIIGSQAGHYVFLNEATDGLKNEAPLFFTDPPGVDRKLIHEQVLKLAIDHFRKEFK
jgi:predicted dienelactone hydrolase